MNKPASKEPSMDEILSSIRQIIADEDEPQDGGGTASNSQVVAAPVSEAEADQAMMAVEETAQVSTQETPEPENNAPITVASEVTEEPFSLSPDQMVADTSAEADVSDVENIDTPSSMDAIPPLADEPDDEIPPDELAVEEAPVMQALDTPEPKDALSGLPAEMVLADDIAFDEPEGELEVEIPEVEEAPSAMPDPNLSADIADKLLEPATTAAVGNAFAKQGALSAVGAEGITLDAIVREMLRPMLKEWLDENLPATVERMVEKEIERVSRGS